MPPTEVAHHSKRLNSIRTSKLTPHFAQDVLSSVPAVWPLVVVDALLRYLTHPKALLRRLAFLALLLSFYLSLHSFFSLRRLLALPSSVSPASSAKWAKQDAEAAAYIAPAPTTEQTENELRLRELIDVMESGFDWRTYHTPKASDTASAAAQLAAAAGRRRDGVTAVLLHWKRRKGMELVMSHLARYPYIREIIVWNNRPGIELSPEEFRLHSPPGSRLPPPVVRVFNSPSNMHDAGKHFGCAMASYDTCYFNDDDWLNVYMDALYTKYLACCAPGKDGKGGRIVSNTMPVIHLEHRRWRFENPDIDLHTGFTWLGTGSFVPKFLSTRFLSQQAAAPVGLTQQEALVSDMFFSLWANTYPEQMPNTLVPIDVEGGEVGWSRSAGVDQWTVVYTNVLAAVRQLSDILSQSPSLLPTPFPVAPPPPESHLRAPCLSGLCLFSTSLSPFPSPAQLAHPDPSTSKKSGSWFGAGGGNAKKTKKGDAIDIGVQLTPRFDPWLVSHVNEYEGRWGAVEGGYPTNEWWENKGSWHLAVDGAGRETCWQSWRAPEAQDHFGLHLVTPRTLHTLVLTGSADLGRMSAWEDTGAGVGSWHVYTKGESGHYGWEPRDFITPPTVTPVTRPTSAKKVTGERDGPLVEVKMRFAPIDGREQERVRQIKIVSAGHKRDKLEVCGWDWDGWQI